jgi:hypothetical protein
MTDEEKIEKFDELQKWLWEIAKHGNAQHSILMAHIIREFQIPSPDGEDPESA